MALTPLEKKLLEELKALTLYTEHVAVFSGKFVARQDMARMLKEFRENNPPSTIGISVGAGYLDDATFRYAAIKKLIAEAEARDKPAHIHTGATMTEKTDDRRDAVAGQVERHVRPGKLPTCRDKYGHWVQYPGQIVYVHDDWRLVYVGTLDGRHEFFAEQVQRTKLGPLSFDAAKAALIDLARYNRDYPA